MKRLSLLVLASPLACGFDKDLGSPQMNGSGEDSSSSSDGVSSTTVGTTASDASDTDHVSTTDTDGNTTVAESTGGEPVCGPDTSVLSTLIDDQQDDVQWNPIGLYVDGMGVGIQFGGGGEGFGFDGVIHLRATQEALDAGGPLHANGYLREPFNAPTHPTAWYCFDENTEYIEDEPLTVSFEGLRRLGPCPGGEPVDGTIDVCFGDAACGGERKVDVVIGEDSYTETQVGTSSASSDDQYVADLVIGGEVQGTAGLLGFHATSYQSGAPGQHSSDLTDVFYIVPVGRPDEGAIYCGGSGSSLTYGDDGLISAELIHLTRLGSCSDDGPTDGVGTFCSGFGG
ncbi:MAG TPA: hypothetical protein VG755_14685 [Nannocystaceae bacterium]|nr:hypothetical protein [Nannocystaceae bacterium]